MAVISSIQAFEVLDSRGNPTILSKVVFSDGAWGTFSVPSGASKGRYEAFELRDNNPSRLNGLGVLKAVSNVNNIIFPALTGVDPYDQRGVDKLLINLDETENKARLGANAILSVSCAVAKAAASSQRIPLYNYIQSLTSNKSALKIPSVLFNMIEGGKHSPTSVEFQEFLIVPSSAKTFFESIEIGGTLYSALKQVLSEKDYKVFIGDEAGFVPELPTNHEGLMILKSTIERTQYRLALDVFLGLDVAANSFLSKGSYNIKDKPSPMRPDELVEFYNQLFSEFAIVYLEDPFAESDVASFTKLMNKLSDKTLIVGDDLTSTNPYKLQNAVSNHAINGIVIKPNQIGTLSEAIAVSEMAKFEKLKVIVAHRSGETTDSFISDFAIGIGADFVKFGAPARERIANYNRLAEIAHEIQPEQNPQPQ